METGTVLALLIPPIFLSVMAHIRNNAPLFFLAFAASITFGFYFGSELGDWLGITTGLLFAGYGIYCMAAGVTILVKGKRVEE